MRQRNLQEATNIIGTGIETFSRFALYCRVARDSGCRLYYLLRSPIGHFVSNDRSGRKEFKEFSIAHASSTHKRRRRFFWENGVLPKVCTITSKF